MHCNLFYTYSLLFKFINVSNTFVSQPTSLHTYFLYLTPNDYLISNVKLHSSFDESNHIYTEFDTDFQPCLLYTSRCV